MLVLKYFDFDIDHEYDHDEKGGENNDDHDAGGGHRSSNDQEGVSDDSNAYNFKIINST